MKLEGKLAIVTGGGDGMGKELVLQLCAAGASVALCDLSPQKLDEMKQATAAVLTPGSTVSTHLCDVSSEEQIKNFAKEVQASHQLANKGILLFNNAGVSTAGSMIFDQREQWEKTFNICWYGVYYSVRAFLPLLLAAPEGYIVNTSSMNGFFSNSGFLYPNTAYSAAKFAIRGFTEALIEDFRLHAPHIKVGVVMPGVVATNLFTNSSGVAANLRKELSESGKLEARTASRGNIVRDRFAELKRQGDHVAVSLAKMGFGPAYGQPEEPGDAAAREKVMTHAQTTPKRAAEIILEHVKSDRWRILVGDDVVKIDEIVRENPEAVYADPNLSAFVHGNILSGMIRGAPKGKM